MNIGLGLQAANAYFKEDDARKAREYQQALRDAELSTLPQATENRRSRLTLESANLRGDIERQPVEQQTKSLTAGIGLSNAQNEQANLPKTQAIRNNTVQSEFLKSSADLDTLPDRLERMAVQGVLDKQGQVDVVVGTLGQLISRQDKDGALRFANNVAKRTNLIPTSNGKSFTDIVPVRGGPQGDGYNFVTTDGQQHFVPAESIIGAMGTLRSGKYKFIRDNDTGMIFAGNENTGSGKIVVEGDPTRTRSLQAQRNPADVQSAEWLMANVPRFKSNPELAWDAVRSSREKTRNSFVLDYVAKNSGMGKDPRVIADEAGKIYDELRQGQGAPSNRPAPGTLGSGSYDPRINSLIGVPSQ